MLITDCKPLVIEEKSQLLNVLHVLLAHEAEAEQEYNALMEALPMDSFGAYGIAEQIEEIRRDERNHMGVLLRCIGQLCPEEIEEMGEES